MTVQYYVNPDNTSQIKKYRGSEKNVKLPNGRVLTNLPNRPDGAFDLWPEGRVDRERKMPHHNESMSLVFNGHAVIPTYVQIQKDTESIYNQILNEIRQYATRIKNGGFIFNGNGYGTDDSSILKYNTYKGTTIDVMVSTTEDTLVVITPTQYEMFIAELIKFFNDCDINEVNHIGNVNRLFNNGNGNPRRLDAYDITGNWPANPGD